MVDREEKGGENRGGTGMLKEHGQENCEKGGATVMPVSTGWPSEISWSNFKVQDFGTSMPSNTGWQC